MPDVIRLADYRRPESSVYFNRDELNQLLSLYSRHVARGEWRDYGIDHRPGAVMFLVYRRTCDAPLFTISKLAADVRGGAKLRDGTGAYLVRRGHRTVKHGRTIDEVLSVFRKDLRVVSGAT